MNILIVGLTDEQFIQVGRELDLTFHRRWLAVIGTKTPWPMPNYWRAPSLDQAKALLPYADAVLSAQTFSTHPRRALEPAETRENSWAGLALGCVRSGKPFVLLTQSPHLAARMNAVVKDCESTTSLVGAFHFNELAQACQALAKRIGNREQEG